MAWKRWEVGSGGSKIGRSNTQPRRGGNSLCTQTRMVRGMESEEVSGRTLVLCFAAQHTGGRRLIQPIPPIPLTALDQWH